MATQTYRYQLIVEDDGPEPLHYSLDESPDTMAVSTTSGLITWPTDTDDLGAPPVKVRVTDAAGAWATQQFNLEVKENTPPEIISYAVEDGYVGVLYTYDVEATDPDQSDLFYELTQRPSKQMTIDSDDGVIEWIPQPEDENSHPITVTVRDKFGAEDTQEYTLVVHDRGDIEDIDFFPPEVTVTAEPSSVLTGQSVTITVEATDDVMVASVELTVRGTQDDPSEGVVLVLGENDQAVYTPGSPGGYIAEATATDLRGEVGRGSADFYAQTTDDNTQPIVAINAPEDGTELKTPTEIIGTASDTNLFRYTLAYRPVGEDDFIAFRTGYESIVDDVLGTLDTTTLLNGLHEIRLRAEDLNGNISDAFAIYRVTGDMKVGNFTMSLNLVRCLYSAEPRMVTQRSLRHGAGTI